MEKLYYQVPYVQTFDAQVISCQKGKDHTYEVELDRTGFYPEGGGQPSDTGYLNEVRVLAVYEKDGRIIHDTETPVREGTHVKGIIDWEKRYSKYSAAFRGTSAVRADRSTVWIG